MSQDVEELQKATTATRQAQEGLEKTVGETLKPAIARAQASADAAHAALAEVRAAQEALAARVAALEARLDGADATHAATVRAEAAALERRLAQEGKAREQGAWAVFDRKTAAAAEATAQQLAAFRAEVGAAVDAKVGEVMAATRRVREGERSLRAIEQQLRRSEQLVQAAERVSARVDGAQRTAAEALAAAQRCAQSLADLTAPSSAPSASFAAERPAPVAEASVTQMAMMEDRVSQQLTKIECAGQLDHARVMDAVQRVEQERESLVQAIQQELFVLFTLLFSLLSPLIKLIKQPNRRKMRQENARIIAEEVERRVAQELEWRCVEPTATRPRAPTGDGAAAAPAPAESSAAEDENKAAAEPAPAQTSFADEFLGKCGLRETYGARFAEMGYDSELAIKLMDEGDLDTLGITALGHRRILLNAIAELNHPESAQQ